MARRTRGGDRGGPLPPIRTGRRVRRVGGTGAPSTAAAAAPARTKPSSGRSPSTVRRQLAQVEHKVQTATEQHDRLTAEMATLTDHRELGSVGDRLTEAQHLLDAAEERWLSLAAEAEALGLDLSS